jgi:hypothetical protein
LLIEIMTFRLLEATSEKAFLAADRRVQTEFAYQQPGMIRRTTSRDEDGEWAVIDFWATRTDADGCLDGWHADPVPIAFMDLVDPDSVRVRRYESLD